MVLQGERSCCGDGRVAICLYLQISVNILPFSASEHATTSSTATVDTKSVHVTSTVNTAAVTSAPPVDITRQTSKLKLSSVKCEKGHLLSA